MYPGNSSVLCAKVCSTWIVLCTPHRFNQKKWLTCRLFLCQSKHKCAYLRHLCNCLITLLGGGFRWAYRCTKEKLEFKGLRKSLIQAIDHTQRNEPLSICNAGIPAVKWAVRHVNSSTRTRTSPTCQAKILSDSAVCHVTVVQHLAVQLWTGNMYACHVCERVDMCVCVLVCANVCVCARVRLCAQTHAQNVPMDLG